MIKIAYKIICSTLCFLLVSHIIIAQNHKIDSLKALLAQSNKDTNRVIYMNKVAYLYHYLLYTDSLEYYANKALKLAEEINYQRGVAYAYNNIGIGCSIAGDYDNSIVAFKKAQDTYRSIHDKRNENSTMNNISAVYQTMGSYLKALENYQKLITYYEQKWKVNPDQELGTGLTLAYMNMGVTYFEIGDYSKCFDYYLKSLETVKKVSSPEQLLASLYMNMGIIKAEIGEHKEARKFYNLAYEISLKNNNKLIAAQYYAHVGELLVSADSLDQALTYYEKAIVLSEGLKNARRKSMTLNATGEIYLTKNKPDTALLYFNQSLNTKLLAKSYKKMAKPYIGIAMSYRMKNRLSLALQAAHQGLNSALEVGALKEATDATRLLHSIYHETGNSTEALKYLIMHKNYNDSLLNNIKIKELASLQSRHEINEITQKKEVLTKENELREKELEKSQAQLKTQKIIVNLSLITISIAIIFTAIIYKMYASRKRTHALLKHLNYEIIGQRDQIKTQAKMLAKANEEISTMNESLENTIELRKDKLYLHNIKIKELAFSNTHKINTPALKLREFSDVNIKKEADMKHLYTTNHTILHQVLAQDKVPRELGEFLNENMAN